MVSKRKKALISDGLDGGGREATTTATTAHETNVAKAPRLSKRSDSSDSSKTRRSERLRATKSAPAATTSISDMAEAMKKKSKKASSAGEKHGKSGAGEEFPVGMEQSEPWRSQEVVDEVRRDLKELQEMFQTQTKKRQRDIENSHLHLSTDEAGISVAEEIKMDGKDLVLKARKDKDIVMDGLGRPGFKLQDRPLKPWVGRLGYACLNTYLRDANPPVFCSRTCRLSTIESRSHPLTDPTQPFHATKNPPDRNKPKDASLGLQYVQSLGLANARDMIPMIRWNARNGIFFMRLSSEMFPFASHGTQGYVLGFAKDVLKDAGRVAGMLGHRVSVHPGQYTQLGSPRDEVVRAAVRDLEYHTQMLEYMDLPDQLNRDAVMIIHMGGIFGDKEATLKRFAKNYKQLRPAIQERLVLENDDACWSVHDLLPICEKLNIPLVLDWHHHTVIYDEAKGMNGTHEELIPLLPRIADTWHSKKITQKMHYSEAAMVTREDGTLATPRDRRKHSARVRELPPWRAEADSPVDMVIEAKDKEQAVFELLRRFEGEGWVWENVGDVLPHVRGDQGGRDRGDEGAQGQLIDAVGKDVDGGLDVGGVERRVYWPEGHDEWLRPKKRVRRPKEEAVADGGGDGPE